MNDIDKTTCWYSANLHLSVNKLTRPGFNLADVPHGMILKQLFKLIPIKEKSVVDIGCGNAKASTIIGDRIYTGLDLSNNIKTIARVNYPNLKFIECDIIEEDVEFISEYDIVLMNALIDIMQYPLQVLDKVLKNCRQYVVLHRQEIVEGETNVKKTHHIMGSLITRRLVEMISIAF